MRRASSSRLTSPSTAEAVPPAFAICSTRLSTPPQFVSRSPGALCSLATPAGRTSETTTATPLAASARAVELPMPTGLPQPVISATRDVWGMGFSLFCLRCVTLRRFVHQRQDMAVGVAKKCHPEIVVVHRRDQMRRTVKDDAALRQFLHRQGNVMTDEINR